MPRTINQYLSYSFVDKDPIIDRMRTLIADEGVTYDDVHIKSGVAVSTLHNWFLGKTRRPQFATIMAVARGLGYDLTLTRRGEIIKFKPKRIKRVA
jgi:transcriptional regulator with XRE-family HTH domain